MPHASILYAEDDALVRDAVVELLEDEGFVVEACAGGDSALERLAGAVAYDLLLFDNELPRVRGVELARHARTLAHYRDKPIVILSAGRDEDEALRAGADLFLRKPEDVGRLAETVGALLARARRH